MNTSKPLRPMSWSKVNLFLQCSHCFYKQEVLKIKRPGIDPDCFSLNNAVDTLLKNEFDGFRKKQVPHPLMKKNGIEAIPYMHESLATWRNYRKGGIRVLDEPNGLELFGVVDELLINVQQELIIIDYKSTARKGSVILDLSGVWHKNNAKQISFYAYLFKKNGYSVYAEGYFMYLIANSNLPALNQHLEFETRILPYRLDFSWIQPTLQNIQRCLSLPKAPAPLEDCDFCRFSHNGGIN